MSNEPRESIVNATIPSAGRIYDYLLGGHHNFDVDRQAAEHLLAMSPFASKMVRLQRWCLQDIAVELTKNRGFDTIIDFASGLPTQDNIHIVVPEGTIVIYSDYDPVVVEYAREILGTTPNVHYFEADARHPEELLSRPEVQAILGDKRDVGLITWGLGMFLRDDDIGHIASTLYEWAGPNSCWAFNAQGADFDPDLEVSRRTKEMYQRMGTPLYFRSKERYEALISPWRLTEPGFIPLLEWHGFDLSELGDEVEGYGESGAGYGGYLLK